MKLVSVECFFDCSKYVFYFTSEGRVDFRELVKLLVSRFPVRIEMRQIGGPARGQDDRRNRLLRAGTVLLKISNRLQTGVRQDGEEPETSL